ncbi:MAG: acyl-CoA desaturase [Burkholderiales bacterium]
MTDQVVAGLPTAGPLSAAPLPAPAHLADPDRHMLRTPGLQRAQRLHVLLTVWLPLLLLVLGPLYLPKQIDVGLAVVSFMLVTAFVGCLGISVGFHRHFAHRAFRAAPWVRALMAVAGQMAGQGPVLYWAALHRRHHAFSDQPGDPHSPALRAHSAGVTRWQAFRHSQFTWPTHHAVPMPGRYVPDLLADPLIRRINSLYYPCMLASYALPTLMGWAWTGTVAGAIVGFYFGAVVRMVVSTQTIMSINSVCHSFGSRPFNTGDFSTNNPWLAWITFGECWHNNHHHAPTHARFGHSWLQPDPGWWTIWVMARLGLAWDVLGENLTAAQRGQRA